ncbi:MAG: NADH:flavin oxidoreductase/NADH oxidase family protein [Hyphomonadaceae bacterium]|nr:NADH:flavin oxidoreductase/NADH oxidase family protein [Hyphomonadaceae bacterium]
MTSPADILRQPLALGAETLPNRLAKGAMTEGLADSRGRPTARHARLYGAWAQGGAGLLISGNVIIDRDHLERPGNVILDRAPDAEAKAAFAAWAQAARAHGAGFWMQISHAGRQTMATVNPAPKSASDVALAMPGKQFAKPSPLSEAEILDLVRRFAQAAVHAREAGFTGVQIHAAHGYLLSQFLSPLANRRTDAWGGPLENRARFLLEAVRAVRAAVGGDFTLSVKLNSADFQRGGFDGGESLTVAQWLGEAGVDVLEISGGSYEQPRMMGMDGLQKPDLKGLPASTAAREAYFLDFASEMRRRVAMPLMVTGGFRTAAAMARAITDDGVALIGLGRPLCVDTAGPAALLAGAAALDRSEDRLRIGPGLLGPKSPIGLIKALNGFGATYWYYQQLRRIADGQGPDRALGVFKALQQEQAAQAAWLASRASA